jgi:hypothetical protein
MEQTEINKESYVAVGFKMKLLAVRELHRVTEDSMHMKCQSQFLARSAMWMSSKSGRRCTVLVLCNGECRFAWQILVEFYGRCQKGWSEPGSSSSNFLRSATLIYDERDLENAPLLMEQKYDCNESVRAMEVFERVGGEESTDFVRTTVKVKDKGSLPEGFELGQNWMKAKDRFSDGSG